MFRRAALRRVTARIASLSVALGMLVAMPIAAVATAPAAQAATISVTGVQAQMAQHQGTTGTNAGNCIKYSPAGTATSSAFVSSPAMALTAHGYPSNSNCPATLDTTIQSALGVTPSAALTIQDGVLFPLVAVTHYNNPITGGVAARYTGQMSILLGGFDTSPTLTYDWSMWETPNTADPCAFPTGPNQNGCADQLVFTSSVIPQTLTKDGVTYKLVLGGFSPVAGGTCPASPAAPPETDFLTAERATSTACLYASISQVRSLRVVKQVIAPTGTVIPGFDYSSSSSVTGSPWAGTSFTLTPPGTASRTAELLQGETVTVTEGVPPGGKWALTALSCVDGAGAPMPGATYDVAAGSFTLASVGAPATTAAGPVTCTFTNTYTPKGTLTLRKIIDGGTATVANFTLSANGPTPISGVSGTASVTSQTVNAGQYSLSETANTAGYVPDAWACTGGALTGSSVTVTDGATVDCVINNRYATGSLQITKTIIDPSGGFAGTSASTFSGTYTCGTAAAVPFTVSTGTPFVVSGLAAGQICRVTENAPPTSLLRNTSYVWGTPTVAPASVTIADRATATAAITNRITQQTGTVSIDKVVAPRSGVLATGYTGGTTRSFPVSYVCTINGQTVASGSTTIQPDGTRRQIGNLPAGSSCTFTETLTAATGDFLDASFRWDGVSWSVNPIVIQADTTTLTTATNYFARDFASLTVTKTVSGGGYSRTSADFSVVVTCAGVAQTITLANGGNSTIQVPANTLCSVVETAPSNTLLAPSHVWGPATYSGLTNGGVSVPPTGTATVGVTNPTVPVYGRVSVTKAIAPAAFDVAVKAAARFSITVSCNAPARGQATNYSQTFSAAVGPAYASPDLPVGTSCTVTEAAPPQSNLVDASYAWGATPAAQTVSASVRDGVVNATVTNTIQRVYGTLAITKVIDNPFGALPGDQTASTVFSGQWFCRYGNDPEIEGTWTRTGAGAATLAGPTGQILVGSSCRMTETGRAPARPSSDPSYRWGAQVVTGPVTVLAGEPAQLQVTNPVVRITSGFSVAKVVRGGEAPRDFADTAFTFDFTCTNGATGSIQVKDGETKASPVTVPSGTTCTVTEDTNSFPATVNPYVWRPAKTEIGLNTDPPAVRTSVTFTVGDDGTLVRAFNYLEPERLTVYGRKAITGATAGYVDSTKQFELSLVCTLNGGPEVAYRPTPATTPTGVYTNTTEQAEFLDVPRGSICQIREDAIPVGHGLVDASYQWQRNPSFDTNVTISSSGQVLTITNTIVRVTGALALSKVLVDPDAVTDPTRTYSGAFTCTHPGDPDVTGTWTINGAGEATLTYTTGTAPYLGSVCTPTEAALTAPPSETDPSYRWAVPTLTPDDVTADTTARMLVTNTVQRQTSVLQVRKTISGQTLGYVGTGDQFTVGYSCYNTDPTQALEGQVTIPANGVAQTLAEGIPTGWQCRVAESPPGAGLLRNPSYVWGAPTIGGTTGGLLNPVPSGTTELVVDNPIARRVGTFEVLKALDPATPASALATGATFTGTYQCDYNLGADDQRTQSGTWSVTGTGTATLSPTVSMPVGTQCRVTGEEPLTQTQLADASWRWDPAFPTIGAAVTIQGATETPEVTVTNRAFQVYSSMTVTKVYEGVAGAFASTLQVGGTWRCLYNGDEVASGTWRTSALGGTVELFRADGSISDAEGPILVPATSQCEVIEETLLQEWLTDESYRWNAESYDPPNRTVATVEDQTVGIRVSNSVSRVFAPLSIRKAIQAPAGITPRTDTTFRGEYSCERPGNPVQSGQWAIPGTGTTAIQGILVGSTCRVFDEQAILISAVTGDDSYKWMDPIYSVPVTTAQGGQSELVVTNVIERILTDITIAKVLGGTVTVPDGTLFTFDWSCTAEDGTTTRQGTISIPAGGRWTSDATIPLASNCSVTETQPDLRPRTTWQPVTYEFDATTPGADSTTGSTALFKVPQGFADRVVAHPVITATNVANREPAGYRMGKTADPVSGTQVRPGDTITYTVTVIPTGTGVMDRLTVTDDLSQVLPFATLGAVTPTQGSAVVTGTSLVWTVGATSGVTPITLTYAVTVKPDAWGATIRNLVVPNGEYPPEGCPALPRQGRFAASVASADLTGCDRTEHPVVPAWTFTKSADPASGSVVRPGQTVAYRVTVRNLSAVTALGPVTVTDDLSQVLPYAELIGIDPAPVGAASVTGTTLTWSVTSVPAAGSVTLVYRVRVKPDAGGTTMRNLVTGTGTPPGGGGGGTPPPSDCPTCTTSTEHPVSATWILRKDSNPAPGSTVRSGDKVTYTLTVTSQSRQAMTNLVLTDDLTGVLPYATMGTMTPSMGAVSLVGSTMTWTIASLPSGASATLVYDMTVTPAGEGKRLRNVVVGTGDTPPDQCVQCAVESLVYAPPVPLAKTGADVWSVLRWALLLILGGAVLVVGSRRREAGRHTRR